jgi:hypothetical protein
MTRAVTFDEWLQLSDAERESIKASWGARVYEDGYWHSLVEQAAQRFSDAYASARHVRRVFHSLYHGGELVIGVQTDLEYPRKLRLPESYLGFRVVQACGGTPEGTIVTPAPTIHVDI